ncbi:MAG TPA: ABC transporter ATP-binding protein [Segeticoccus sp.]|uniref:ABC transporter ATP-binding protein n=1 Tax=Segeticoccus sp. TaxID=2706531 RepID=UPI002D7ECD6E|nr:ABC transporter ATP-binding protein [Segeticoccus sp.]HET8600452.1 ABC transporter ATP-binding protein [Segeticoccus sp.]
MSVYADVALRRGTLDLQATLEVPAAGVTAVLGPNGSGKTTLLSALAGLLPLERGSVTLVENQRAGGQVWEDAAAGTRLPADQRRVGLVLADHLLFPHLSVLDNVAYGPRSRGAGRREARGRAYRELEAVGLGDRAGERPSALSSGQAQRAALARALATDPLLLLLDEPLSALDPQTRARTRADLAGRLREFPGATVLVTHDPLDALTLGGELVFLEGGRVVQRGRPAEVVTRPRSGYVAEVVGLNLWAGEALDDAHVRVGSVTVMVAQEPELVAGRPAWVAIAPSAVALYADRPAGSPRNTWPLTVRDVQPAGQSARVGLTGPVELAAEVTTAAVADLRIGVGQQLWATVKASEVRAYPA